ncbi:MAG TPA: nitrate/nitrite transporter NrtS, partial [Candidatus Acidoferrales bacterium]|nr:nitrate/nitrite transporter NrtS [Candidatus Acidoferrales bacterium]
RYAFSDASGRRDPRCTRHALIYPRVRDRALRVALVVGVVLFAINQLDVVIRGDVTPVVIAKILLTFAVPYGVSTYSALQVNRLG